MVLTIVTQLHVYDVMDTRKALGRGCPQHVIKNIYYIFLIWCMSIQRYDEQGVIFRGRRTPLFLYVSHRGWFIFTRYIPVVGSTMGQRRRCWTIVEPTLVQTHLSTTWLAVSLQWHFFSRCISALINLLITSHRYSWITWGAADAWNGVNEGVCHFVGVILDCYW